MTLKTYKEAHPAFSNEQSYRAITRRMSAASASVVAVGRGQPIKRKRKKLEFDAASVQKWSITTTSKQKFYSINMEEMCLR